MVNYVGDGTNVRFILGQIGGYEEMLLYIVGQRAGHLLHGLEYALYVVKLSPIKGYQI